MLTQTVTHALTELASAFTSQLQVVEEPDGSAWVEVDDVQLPERYRQRMSFVLFRIPAQYPYADIYPVFVRPDLSTTDDTPLGPAMTTTAINLGGTTRQVTQISRRTNRLDGTHQSAMHKIDKVLAWLEDPK